MCLDTLILTVLTIFVLLSTYDMKCQIVIVSLNTFIHLHCCFAVILAQQISSNIKDVLCIIFFVCIETKLTRKRFPFYFT